FFEDGKRQSKHHPKNDRSCLTGSVTPDRFCRQLREHSVICKNRTLTRFAPNALIFKLFKSALTSAG
ncbi:MAG: hypothetical protein IJ087_12845, partial [Eggerthellaceae bacterium]|nr:hypothetical protein [Eggerthellaceae bacterium]